MFIVLYQVLDYITDAEEDVVNEERQQVKKEHLPYDLINLLHCTLAILQALLELWNAGVLRKFDEEKLLVKAESAKLCVHICSPYI